MRILINTQKLFLFLEQLKVEWNKLIKVRNQAKLSLIQHASSFTYHVEDWYDNN